MVTTSDDLPKNDRGKMTEYRGEDKIKYSKRVYQVKALSELTIINKNYQSNQDPGDPVQEDR